MKGLGAKHFDGAWVGSTTLAVAGRRKSVAIQAVTFGQRIEKRGAAVIHCYAQRSPGFFHADQPFRRVAVEADSMAVAEALRVESLMSTRLDTCRSISILRAHQLTLF